jgi:hypothetical protein
MGQKTERIKELETELTAASLLLRHIGDTLGIEFRAPTNPAEAMKEHQRFLTALANPPGRPGATPPADIPSPRRRIKPGPGSWDTFDEEVDHQIDRMEAQGLTAPREASGALVRRDTSDAYSPRDPDLDALERMRTTILAIGGELGLNVTESRHDEALAAIHEEILRVKNLGADVEAESGSKFLSAGKSLGQAIAHDHAQAEDLRDAATQARTIVARLAAVMQIGTWDKDGTELLERAQKWEMWKHDLMKRIRELRATRPSVTASLDDGDVAQLVARELQRQLDRLLTPKELQNWLKSMERAGATVKVDAGPLAPPYPFTFAAEDVVVLLLAAQLATDPESEVPPSWRIRYKELEQVLLDLRASVVAQGEFARTMNMVILPILARQRAAQKVPDSANPG